jgi:hypothetical protein
LDKSAVKAGSADCKTSCDWKGIMTGTGNTSGFRRWITDFALAFVLFWAVAFAVSISHTRAYAVPLPVLGKELIVRDSAQANNANFRASEANRSNQAASKVQSSPGQALLLLSLAFAAIAAFNLGFWRHLRRAYASPRRSVWRRG